MAGRRKEDMEFEPMDRKSPYQQLNDQDFEGDYEEETEEIRDEEEEQGGGMMSTILGKIVVIVIVLLLIALAVLVYMAFPRKNTPKEEPIGLPGAQQTLVPEKTPDVQHIFAPEETQEPASIVFMPATQEPTQTPEPTDEPQTPEPSATPTATPSPSPSPSAVPEPTATPLPVILTNTPTPTPTARPTATPEPTPTPEPTATPTPTPAPSLASGKTNRSANLREEPSAKGKVKQTLKQDEAVTVHEVILDDSGKTWYALTADDLAIDGYMRDYVVSLNEELATPAASPKAEVSPEAEGTPTPAPTPRAEVIATGITNREANLRKVMNGKVIVQVKKNREVDILAIQKDKKGDVWYQVQPKGSDAVGFMRDYVVSVDAGADLGEAATPVPTNTPVPSQESDVLEREVVGKATTNRAANVREKPTSGAKLVRQLSKGIKLQILGLYQDKEGAVWYEVATETGKTHGFVRDYVINITQIDSGLEAKTFE